MEILNKLGSVYNDLGRYGEAKQTIELYISKEKDKDWQYHGYNMLGNISRPKGKLEKLRKAIKKLWNFIRTMNMLKQI